MIIRNATEDDLDGFLTLLAHLHAGEMMLDPTAAATRWKSMLQQPGQHVFVAEIEKMLVSSCTLNIIANLTRSGRPYALIENVVTLSDYRNQGLATALLRHAQHIAWNSGCYKIMLMTGSKQKATLRFYERAGFSAGVKTAFVMHSPT